MLDESHAPYLLVWDSDPHLKITKKIKEKTKVHHAYI
jgi:hypothetical protein